MVASLAESSSASDGAQIRDGHPNTRTHFSRRGGAIAAGFIAAGIGAAAGGQALAPIFTLCALIAVSSPVQLRALQRAIANGGAALLLFSLFWLWLAATCFWSPQENHKTQVAVLLYLPALLVFAWSAASDNQTDKNLVIRAGAACVFAIAILSAQEGFFDFPFYTAERGGIRDLGELISARHTLAGAGSALAVLLWPVVSALDRKGGRAYLVLVIPIALTFIVARYSHASSILLSLGIGMAGYLAARAYPRVAITATGLIIADLLLFAPQLIKLFAFVPEQVQRLLPPSYFMRIQIWQNTASFIEQKPWFGWGLDASKTFTQIHEYTGIGPSRVIPWHPHNAALHLWLELGLVGVALASALIVALTLWLVRRLSHDRKASAGAVGAICAFFVFAGVSFGAWQAWFLSCGFAAAALIAAQVKKQ